MKKKEFETTLRSLMKREPFQPFVVELVDGEQFWITVPDSVALNAGAAGHISPEMEIHFFNFRTVRRFVTPARESA